MKNIDKVSFDTEMSVNDILRFIVENKDEHDFFNILVQKVKQEFMDEVTKRIENLSFFENVYINYKGLKQWNLS